MSRRYRAVFDKNGLLAEFEGDSCVFLREDYEPPNRSHLPAPGLISDHHEPFLSHADGRVYDSKSAYRRTLKEKGYVELGNDAPITGKPFGAPLKNENRRKLLHKQLADVSDREATKALKQLKKSLSV